MFHVNAKNLNKCDVNTKKCRVPLIFFYNNKDDNNFLRENVAFKKFCQKRNYISWKFPKGLFHLSLIGRYKKVLLALSFWCSVFTN